MNNLLKKESNLINRFGFIILVGIVLASIIFAYSNHFSNSFHFDDRHTIETNINIQEVNAISFFTDATTISSLPTNQTYRPITTLENAIDYKIAGGLETEVFHIHIFLIFLIVCFLISFFVKKLLDEIQFSEINKYWALLNGAIFGLLCANAETVNYIIQRAEITAALFVLLGFITFLKGGFWRTKYIYLLFPFIGFFAKEMAFVFAPLLFIYLLLFEEEVDLLRFYKEVELRKIIKSFLKALPAITLTVVYYGFYTKMVPQTFSPGGLSQFNYLITQPMVMVHYIVTYFIPYNLSADTDWTVYTSIFDYRVLTGVSIVALLIYLALKTSKNKDTRLISFGILWFFVSLLPTSSFIPFAEVLNDHRSFIPYIGLTIAFVFGVNFVLQKYLHNSLKNPKFKIFIYAGIFIFLAANVYGVRERNKVWKNDITLWKDVTIKSPNNGRGLMNYGLALMAKGDYINAEIYFKKALILTPNYSNLYINLGIVKNAIGNKSEAENYFKKAIEISPFKHICFHFYGRFLLNNNRTEMAIKMFEKALKISPNYLSSQTLLMDAYHKASNWEKLKSLSQKILKVSPNNSIAKKHLKIALNKKPNIAVMEEDVKKNPTSKKYLNLSLKYFQLRKYEKTISSAKLALTLNKNYYEAYNNMGIAYFMLGKHDKAIEAYKNALNIKPDYNLAKNNLANAIKTKENKVNKKLTANDFLNLSLKHYNNGNFIACIEAAKKSNKISPSSNAFNNICAAYNALKQYDKALKACNNALKLNPKNNFAKGNLEIAVKNKSL